MPVTSKKKFERALVNMLIGKLLRDEAVQFEIVEEDVPSTGGGDFDFLLRSDAGDEIAVEITQFPDEQNELRWRAHRYQLKELIESLSIPQATFIIEIPGIIPFSNAQVKLLILGLRLPLLKEMERLKDGETGSVESELGVLRIRRMSGPAICDVRTRPHHLFATLESETESFDDWNKKTLPRKAKQLATPSRRRVLLVSNERPLARVDVATSRLEHALKTTGLGNNIDEVYLRFKSDPLVKVWPS